LKRALLAWYLSAVSLPFWRFRLVEVGRVEEDVVELSELQNRGILRHGIRSLTC
jgi:hypothetical protein